MSQSSTLKQEICRIVYIYAYGGDLLVKKNKIKKIQLFSHKTYVAPASKGEEVVSLIFPKNKNSLCLNEIFNVFFFFLRSTGFCNQFYCCWITTQQSTETLETGQTEVREQALHSQQTTQSSTFLKGKTQTLEVGERRKRNKISDINSFI